MIICFLVYMGNFIPNFQFESEFLNTVSLSTENFLCTDHFRFGKSLNFPPTGSSYKSIIL